jgi:hypothetical protein
VQAAGDHQMEHQPEIFFQTDRDPFADTLQFTKGAALQVRERRLCAPQQKRAG